MLLLASIRRLRNGGAAGPRNEGPGAHDEDAGLAASRRGSPPHLRARVAATFRVVWSERDLVATALRVALTNPAALARPRTVA